MNDCKLFVRLIQIWFSKPTDDKPLVMVEILRGDDDMRIDWQVYDTGRPQVLGLGPFKIKATIIEREK